MDARNRELEKRDVAKHENDANFYMSAITKINRMVQLLSGLKPCENYKFSEYVGHGRQQRADAKYCSEKCRKKAEKRKHSKKKEGKKHKM